LELAPLTSAEALELVQELAPELENEKARRFASLARGSPFWLEALVRTEGAEVDAGRLVTARLRGASADAGELLALLVVAGRPLALTDIAQLSGWELPRTEHAVRELVTRGIAVESAAVLQLAHDLIRVAAARELPEEHRLELHRRLADWLADLAGDDIRRLLEALTHRHAAGLSSVDLAGRLARSPQRTLLGEEGLALLTSIADGGDPRDETVGALNDDVAALAAALGRHEVALERRLIAAERRRDPLQRVRARLEAAKSAFALDDRGGARAHLAEARATSTGDDLLDLELDIQQAVLGLWTDGPKEDARALAHDVAGRALRRFEADDRARGPYLEALAVEYEAAYQEDDLEAMVRAAESRAAASRGFDEEIYLTASLAGARALRRIGRLDEARERAGRVWHEAHNRVLPRLALDAGYWLGTFSLQGGRVWEAEEVVESALELASRIGDEARGRHSIERLAAEVTFYSGDWRDGIERLLGYARGASEHAGVELHQLAALWLALAGREDGGDDVLAELGEARACADHAGCPRCTTELRLVGADALVHVGRRTDAAAWLAEWVRMQPHPSPRERFLERRIEALLHDVPPAESLEEVAGQAERLGFVLDALWTNLDLGVVLGDRERAQATDVLAAVAGRARDAGARTVADLAEKRLRGLGVRTWRRGARDGLLTERELTIARLVATGATNPEIAQQLFLSRKTVERHVSNVLRKAGVRNRAELAARAAQLEIEGAHR
jgi:DNA-binding CsgD family transcriptional regulator